MKKRKLFILNLILVFIICSLNYFQLYSSSSLNNEMIIHYIDVGQGDCILIQVNEKNLLIDSGSSSNRNELLNYLTKLKIKKFDYIIATHPHEDHIGNMDTIIKRFDVDKFYSPKVTHPSICFENMVNALIDKSLKINILAKDASKINLGKNTNVEIFSPLKNMISDNYNDYSSVIKLTFHNNSFLFTGDAEVYTENQLLSDNIDLKSDIIKIGHHGSKTSTSYNFLHEVNPSFAIISVGENNTYDHPSMDTLLNLELMNIQTYRTNLNGTIIVTSNGNTISIDSLKD